MAMTANAPHNRWMDTFRRTTNAKERCWVLLTKAMGTTWLGEKNVLIFVESLNFESKSMSDFEWHRG